MESIGDFQCDHELINQVHRNAVCGIRGNVVSVWTDCPQRDERLGWTGDLQAIGPTASFLFDTFGSLSNWLEDLSMEQLRDYGGVPPIVVPDVLQHMQGEEGPPPVAIWADVCIITPKDLFEMFADKQVLRRQVESMRAWLDRGVPRNEKGLYKQEAFQFAGELCSSIEMSASHLYVTDGDTANFTDWLDPKAPADDPGAALTDKTLVADAYLLYVTQLLSAVLSILGESSLSTKYANDHARLLQAFQDEYVTPAGRLMSDTQTGLTLVLKFGLLKEKDRKGAVERLVWLIRKQFFQIGTGFAGESTFGRRRAGAVLYHVLNDGFARYRHASDTSRTC